jgi:hypothetical protein
MEKAEAIALLDRAGEDPPRLTDDEIVKVMKRVVYLPLCYFPAVQEIVREGRWRSAKSPWAYVKAAAKAKAIHMGFAHDPREQFRLITPIFASGPLNTDTFAEYMSAKLSDPFPRKDGGVWRAAAIPEEREYYSEAGERITAFEALVSRLPQELRTTKKRFVRVDRSTQAWLKDAYGDEYREEKPNWFTEYVKTGNLPDSIHEQDIEVPDWPAIGERAGLDEGEILALCFRADGYSRERAIAVQDTPADKKYVQAAWKRLDRKWSKFVEAITSSCPNR